MTAYICTGSFILFDVISGLLKAWRNRKFDSKVMRQGLFNKMAEIIALAFAAFLQYGGKYINIGIDLPVVVIVSSYICLMEFISVIENLCEVNPRLAKVFDKYLKKAKEKEEE